MAVAWITAASLIAMASGRIAVILSVISLLLLHSHATRLPDAAYESSAVDALVRDEPEDANPSVLVSPVDDKEPTTTASLPDLVEGFDHIDFSFRRPFHRRHHRSHRHHRHRWFSGGRVIAYGNDMIPGSVGPKDGLEKEDETAAVVGLPEGGGESGVPEEVKSRHPLAKDCRRKRRNRWEHERKMAREEESDSDSDGEEEEIKMMKTKLRRMRKKARGGWLKWFRGLWN